jgi:hypothetical protein
LRVARTVADIEIVSSKKEAGPQDCSIGPVHLAEALQLRRE